MRLIEQRTSAQYGAAGVQHILAPVTTGRGKRGGRQKATPEEQEARKRRRAAAQRKKREKAKVSWWVHWRRGGLGWPADTMPQHSVTAHPCTTLVSAGGAQCRGQARSACQAQGAAR